MPYLNKHKLRELIDVTRGASLSGEFYNTEGNLIRLTLGNFDYTNGGFKLNTSKENIFYNGPVASNFIMKEGDVITPMTEQTPGLLGSTARIPESGKYVQSQDIGLVTCFEDKMDKDFCYYLLPSAIVRKQLAAGAQQTKIRHTSPEKIKDCTVFIPEPKEQQKIGLLLSNIDKLINIKREENVVLEALAKQIYDYWFVQFDFPNEEGKPYKSSGGKMVWNETLKMEIPEGWSEINLFDGLDVLYGFPFATEYFTEDSQYKPVVRIRDILEGKNSTYSSEEVDEKYRLHEEDAVIGMDGNFHINIWHRNDTYLNQRCVRLREKEGGNVSILQAYFSIKPYLKAKEKVTKGSTVGHLSDKDLKSFYLINPIYSSKFTPQSLLKIAKNMVAKRKEVNELISLRDYLLPLLMNGQVTIKE